MCVWGWCTDIQSIAEELMYYLCFDSIIAQIAQLQRTYREQESRKVRLKYFVVFYIYVYFAFEYTLHSNTCDIKMK